MRNFLSIVFIFFIGSLVKAETVKWLVKPTEYEKITYYSSDVFKCVKNGQVVLLDWNGNPLLDKDVVADSITDFRGGYALILKNENTGFKIKGFLSEQNGHRFQRVEGDYYTSSYPFFSEGFIVVANKKGKLGYLDLDGRCVIECKYQLARPFRKGYASVSENGSRALYINSQGRTNNPIGFHDGKIDKGSSFNDEGEAIVRHEKECVVINREMKVVRSFNYKGVFPIRTYDYAYSEDYVNPELNVNERPNPDKRYMVYDDPSGYGYRDEAGKVLVPSQFSKAYPVCNRRAIVTKDGKCGILEFVDGEFSSYCSSDRDMLVVYPDMMVNNLQYELSIPDQMESEGLIFLFDKGDGTFVETDRKVTFKPSFEKDAKRCVLRSMLKTNDGLLLWSEEKTVDIAHVRIGVSAPAVASTFAMENDIQQIKATITNQSDIEVTVSPSFTVSLDKSKKNSVSADQGTAIRLAPGQKKELCISVKVKENELATAKVSVSVNGHHCGSNTSQVQLKKI